MDVLINNLVNRYNGFFGIVGEDFYVPISLFFLCFILILGLALYDKGGKFRFFGSYSLGLLSLLCFTLLLNRNFCQIKKEIVVIKVMLIRYALQQQSRVYNSRGNRYIFNSAKVKSGLKDLFEEIEMVVEPQHDAVNYVNIRVKKPYKVNVHVAVINLNYPGIEICITPILGQKGLTSDFAKKNDCFVAINGEAGKVPFVNKFLFSNGEIDKSIVLKKCLGIWKGNWIVKGKPVLLADTDKRPFISFDRNNKARYFSERIVDNFITPEKYNTIWGRFDMIVNSQIVASNTDMFQPRTCMGIDAKGNRLFLLVIDGRRQGYSVGMDRISTAKIMKLFGAANAMLCDQGGSSCMYLKPFGGLVSIPSDGDGVERPVFCHFGVAIR